MSSYSKLSAAGTALLVTIIEDTGLIVWLVLLNHSVTYAGIPIPAIVLLLVLLVEHSIMQRAENPNFTGRTFGRIFVFSTLEVINWSVWLTLLSSQTTSLLSMSSLAASLYFFIGFYIEHQITENVITDRPLLRFRNAKGVITAGVIAETLSEGVGARLWIFFATTMGPLSIAFLVVGSLVEHSIQYVVGRVPVTTPVVNQ
jgi:hypothetical protein